MKTRQEIKAIAKDAAAGQRTTAIMIVFILGALSFLLLRLSDGITNTGSAGFGIYNLIYWAGMCILYVTTVNICGEFIKIYKRQNASVEAVFRGFEVNFLRKLGGMYWVTLWIFLWMLPVIIYGFVILYALLNEMLRISFWNYLWALLFVIPGIVKMFAYHFTANILADCPNVTARKALRVSLVITHGYKMDIFIFVLSWIGWMMLSAMTFGILWIAYVGPYYHAADAGLYLELRDKALRDGRVKPEDLGWEPGTVPGIENPV
jgi:uncharacterized membrane protein